jgi:GNAT superfamily N-acetyltransferase
MIEYLDDPEIDAAALEALFADAWLDHTPRDFSRSLAHGLGHVCAIEDGALVGFVKVAWDGDQHAFLLDPTVRTDRRHQGIGTRLVRHAADLARARGVTWLHVDFEPHLADFYAGCGFRPTEAGLLNLESVTSDDI